MNALLTYDYGSIKDPRLYEVTDRICNMLIDINEDCFAIAALVAKVEDDNLLYNDDFDDICDYVKKCFGFEKTTTYNLLKIGREYLVTFENGNIQTLLKHGVRDYSISQVIKMLPLGVDKAKELTRDEVITPDMSCRKIEKIVKQNLKRMVIDDPDDIEEIEEIEDVDDMTEEVTDKCKTCMYYIEYMKGVGK